MIPAYEINRKLIHLANLVIPLSYYFLYPHRFHFALLMAVCTGLAYWIDISRRRNVRWVRWVFTNFFNYMLRPSELKGKLTGATWVFLGSFLVVSLFPTPIAVLALLFMSLGDTAAALVGMQFGKIPVFDKTLEGTLAGLSVCLVIAWIFPEISFPVGAIGALVAAAAEVLPVRMDDNLLIPLAAGTSMVLAELVIR